MGPGGGVIRPGAGRAHAVLPHAAQVQQQCPHVQRTIVDGGLWSVQYTFQPEPMMVSMIGANVAQKATQERLLGKCGTDAERERMQRDIESCLHCTRIPSKEAERGGWLKAGACGAGPAGLCGAEGEGATPAFVGEDTIRKGHPGLAHAETRRGRWWPTAERRCLGSEHRQTTPAATSTTPGTPTTGPR